jgi:hypothetical protein
MVFFGEALAKNPLKYDVKVSGFVEPFETNSFKIMSYSP